MTSAGRERLLLGAAAAVAIAVPLAAAHHLDARVQGDLAPALSEVLGEPVQIDGLEVGLTGTLRIRGIRLGAIAEADAVEASLDPAALFSGQLRAAEIRVARPRLALSVGGDDDPLRRVLRRAGERLRSPSSPGPGENERLRRIVVTGGELRIDLGGHGMVAVHGVTLHPQRSGVRAVARGADLDLTARGARVRGTLGRLAADLDPGAATLERLLGVGGDLVVSGPREGDPPLALTAVQVGAGLPGHPGLRITGEASEGGAVELRIRPGAELLLDLRAEDLPIGLAGAYLPAGLDSRAARADGTATVAVADQRTGIDLDLSVRGLRIDHRRIAGGAFDLDLELELQASAAGADLELEAAHLRLGALGLRASGRAVRGAHSWLPDRAALRLELSATGCAAALGALPLPLRERLLGMELSGDLAGTLELAFDRDRPRETTLAITDQIGCRVTTEPAAADVRTLTAPFEHTFPDGQKSILGEGPGYTALRRLPAHLVKGFVAAEDARFHRHNGFDRHQIERSLALDLHHAGVVRGGSTISQQLVKNAFLTRDRSLARKLQEAVLTWRLEAHLGKRLILERYLNIIELGPGIHGVTAAARHWFGKAPADLDPRESAFLITLTPAPATISARIAEAGGIDWQTAHRVEVILGVLRRAGVLSERAHRRALADRLTLRPAVLARAGD